MSSKLEIEYPENLPDVLQTTRARFEQEVKMAMAVKLFEMRRLSSGMAAALVGMDRVSFLLRLIDRSDYSDLRERDRTVWNPISRGLGGSAIICRRTSVMVLIWSS